MGAISGNNNWKTSDQYGEASDRKPNILSERQHRALVEGARMLIDEVLEDYANMYRGRDPGDTIIFAECLPKQFRHRYTESFIKQFIVCVVAVSGRLTEWNGEEIAHSTGECLALYVIMEKATSSLILNDKEMGKIVEEDPDVDFRNFEKVAFVDGEYTFLFDPSLDDWENDDTADYMGIPLKLKDWFIPSYENPAHPYLWGDDLPEGEEDLETADWNG